MLFSPQSFTATVFTQPVSELCGSVKFTSRLAVEGPDPELLGHLAAQIRFGTHQSNATEAIIESIGKLESGWDGYGAASISAGVCANAKRFLLSSPTDLSIPEITPTSYGTMNFEWTSNSAEAYLEIGESRYTGHIQVKDGQTIYLDGPMIERSKESSGGVEQALALISGLLHGTPTAAAISQGF